MQFYAIKSSSYITPIPHIQMGLDNLALVQLSKFIDSYVENVSEDEIVIQVRVKNNETNLNSLLNSIKKDDEQKKI